MLEYTPIKHKIIWLIRIHGSSLQIALCNCADKYRQMIYIYNATHYVNNPVTSNTIVVSIFLLAWASDEGVRDEIQVFEVQFLKHRSRAKAFGKLSIHTATGHPTVIGTWCTDSMLGRQLLAALSLILSVPREKVNSVENSYLQKTFRF